MPGGTPGGTLGTAAGTAGDGTPGSALAALEARTGHVREALEELDRRGLSDVSLFDIVSSNSPRSSLQPDPMLTPGSDAEATARRIAIALHVDRYGTPSRRGTAGGYLSASDLGELSD